MIRTLPVPASFIKINVTSDGQDYTGGDYPVIFPAGSTKENFSIPITDDDIVERDETFFLTLMIPQPAQDTGVIATVTIINDDGECSVTSFHTHLHKLVQPGFMVAFIHS